MKKKLKKPVHVAILKPTHLQKLAKEGKLPKYALSKVTPQQPKLPDGAVIPLKLPEPAYRKVAKEAADNRKKTILRTQLKVLHESAPPIPKEKQPPCDSCKTSACCWVYLVNLTREEYESGIYGDCAVSLSHETSQNIGRGKVAQLATMNTPGIHFMGEDETQYFLEGPLGVACPFLQEDGKCGIYDKRPMTCRTYTCVDDTRITDEMREGTEPLHILSNYFNAETD